MTASTATDSPEGRVASPDHEPRLSLTASPPGWSSGSDSGTGVLPHWVKLVGGALVIAAITLWFRVRAIGASSLWLDDAWVGVAARFPGIGDTIRSGLTSPGFSLAYRGWSNVFGTSTTAAQLLPLSCAVAGAVLLFLAASERGLPWYAALLGAGLLASAPAHIAMSTRLKQYTAEALAMTVVLWVAWRLIERPTATGRWAVFTAAAIAASLVSGTGALLAGSALAVCVTAGLLARPSARRDALTATAIYGLVVLPWVFLAVRPNVHDKLADYWHGYFLDGDGFGGGIGTRLGAVARAFQNVPAGFVGIGLAIAVGIVLARRPLLGLLLVMPSVLAIGLAAFRIVPIGIGRTDVYLLPSYALLVAVAVTEVASMLQARGRRVIGVSALALFVVVTLIAPQLGSHRYTEDLAPLVHLVERSRESGDTILVYPSSGYAYGISTRYPIERQADALQPTDWRVKVRGPNILLLEPHRPDPKRWAGSLDRLAASSPRIWLIGSHFFPDWPVLKHMIRVRGYRVVRIVDRVGAQLVQYVKEPAGTPAANPSS